MIAEGSPIPVRCRSCSLGDEIDQQHAHTLIHALGMTSNGIGTFRTNFHRFLKFVSVLKSWFKSFLQTSNLLLANIT